MNEESIKWLFGIIIVLLFAVCGAIYLLGQRVTKIETIFNFWVETIGKKAAQILHSPGDHLGLDKYLDKFLKEHPTNTLSLQDWFEIKIMCERVERDESVESGKRLVAGFVAAGAIQKIMLMQKRLPTASDLRTNPNHSQDR